MSDEERREKGRRRERERDTDKEEKRGEASETRECRGDRPGNFPSLGRAGLIIHSQKTVLIIQPEALGLITRRV